MMGTRVPLALGLAAFVLAACEIESSCACSITSAKAQSGIKARFVEDGEGVRDRIFFAYDQSSLSLDARRMLEWQAGWLRENPAARVVIQGHADEFGTREYNLALGDKRAAVAREYLVALGIAPDRLSTVSYGKERPAVLGSNEAAWSQNRRVQSIVLQN